MMEENNIIVTKNDICNLKDVIKNNSIIIIGIGLSLVILGVCGEIDNKRNLKGVN